MKKYKIFLLFTYFLFTLIILVESAIPGAGSAAQSDKVSSVVSSLYDFFSGGVKKEVLPNKVILNDLQKEYYVSEEYELEPLIFPKNSSFISLDYQIDNPELAEIRGTNLFFKKEGKVNLIIKVNNTEIYNKYQITIKEKYVTNVDTPSKIIIDVNETYLLNFNITPFDSTEKPQYLIEDNNKLRISNNKIIPLNTGNTNLTISYKNITKKIAIEVINKYPDLEVSNFKPQTSDMLDIAETYFVGDEINVIPIYKSNYEFDGKLLLASQPNIQYDGSKIVFLKEGYVDLIFSLDKHKTSTYTKKVLVVQKFDEDIIVTNIKELTELEITIPKKINIANYKNLNYKFISNNEKILKIDEKGIITPISEGDCLVTISLKNILDEEITYSFNVTVNSKSISSHILNFNYFIRKLFGHFGAFMFYSVFTTMLCLLIFKKKFSLLFSLINGFGIALISELIQLFVPGRFGAFKDVMIDFSGYLVPILGFFIYFIIRRLKNGRFNKIPS